VTAFTGLTGSTAVALALVGAIAALAVRPVLFTADRDRSSVTQATPISPPGIVDTSSTTSTTASSTTSTIASSTTSTTAPPAPVLVWADEFDGAVDSGPDPARWRFDIGGHGWGNAQLEFYDDTRARLDGAGHLVITAEPTTPGAEPPCWYGPCRFVSSRLTTDGLVSHDDGRIEVRARLPRGDATWPAVWMLGSNRAEVGWPACGEIDILEHIGRSGDEVHGALHGPGYSGGAAIVGSTVVDDVTAFHTYRVDWRPESIVWSVDDRPFHRVDRDDVEIWPFDQPFHLIVNLAIGGTLGGNPTDADLRAHELVLDHVRVFDLGD